MTCNPNWSEIKAELLPNEKPQNRPDLLVRVFKSKFEHLKNEVIRKKLFGPVTTFTYVIEFQKRGLPHVHLLLILQRGHKLDSPEKFDDFISAELPNKEKFSHLYSMVVKNMMHDSCGSLNSNNVCMKNGLCKNHYPRDFVSMTTIKADGYLNYRQRNNNEIVKVRGHMLNNKWVVPYNPYLLAKFDCHINVEICSTIKAVNYLWISSPKAMWRIYKFPLNQINPVVISLQLHLEDCQIVSFRKTDDLRSLANDEFLSRTMLTEFFVMNRTNKKAQEGKYLYKKFPEFFVWDAQHRMRNERKQREVIGRIITTNPKEGERYYLRLLLNHVQCPTSFRQLRTIKEVTYNSFREAALQYGLLEDDESHEKCLEEASTFQMPSSLRQLFATILVYCSPHDPKALFLKFERTMSEDLCREGQLSTEQIRSRVCKI
ncbi:uncharacterized protein LOC114307620 [Camellia sinensis]|uniref:uncharacterized protein LOC114307620 n=1 Tax=Camellia sinensis TaxID=4442 RepID=UPI0010363C4C|nr:uncharacterized protein LOC114307620 [Camellia sinensis]